MYCKGRILRHIIQYFLPILFSLSKLKNGANKELNSYTILSIKNLYVVVHRNWNCVNSGQRGKGNNRFSVQNIFGSSTANLLGLKQVFVRMIRTYFGNGRYEVVEHNQCGTRDSAVTLFADNIVVRCVIWYYLHNLKNVKNVPGRVLL